MWKPSYTNETIEEEDSSKIERKELLKLSLTFGLLAATIAGAGYIIAQSGITIATETGLSETFVGGLLTALSTALPELVISVAAVQRGALNSRR